MKLKISGKLAIGFGGVLLISILLGTLAIFKLNIIEKAETNVSDDQYPSVMKLLELQTDISNMRRVSYQYASADGEKKAEFNKEVNDGIACITEDNEEYSKVVSSEEELNAYNEYRGYLDTYIEVTKEALKSQDEKEVESMLAQAQDEYDNVNESLEKLVEINAKYIDEGFQTSSDSIRSARIQIVTFLMISFVFSLVYSVYVCLNIIGSTKKILEGINKISDGDLTSEVEVNSNDEMSMIGNSTNNLVKSLGKMVEDIMKISEQMAASSQELSATCEEVSASTEEVTTTINQLSIGAAEQCESVIESSNIINMMSENIKSVAENAHSVTRSSDNVLKMTNNGLEQVNNAIEKIRNVENSTNEVAQVINVLGEQSNQIGEIVQVIKNISDQTDLLALNAAIEAARAGEHGKGFAVVAEEVRKLAEESSASAESIAKLIGTIQKETLVAVEAINNGTKDVSVGVEVVSISGEVFKNIFNEINVVVNQIKEVDILSGEALKCSNDVVRSIKSISNIAENAAASSEEVAASAEEQNASMESVVNAAETLAELGTELQKSISIFKL